MNAVAVLRKAAVLFILAALPFPFFLHGCGGDSGGGASSGSNTPKHTLTVTITGQGTVSSYMGYITCPGTCSYAYDTGSYVTITAAAAAGSTFHGWSGSCSGNAASCTIVMNSDLSVTAAFQSTTPTGTATGTSTGTGTGTGTSTSMQQLNLSYTTSSLNVETFGATAYRFSAPIGIAVARSGHIYVTEPTKDVIRIIYPPAGALTYTEDVLAGSLDSSGYGIPGSADGGGVYAQFNQPTFLVLDPLGKNLYVSDSGNCTIRKVDTDTRIVTTIAGTAGTCGHRDDIGSLAQFNQPTGITIDPAGENLYVSDFGNVVIRKVALLTGEVTTVAGTPGHNGPADGAGANAQFEGPEGIATDGTNLYVADILGQTVRQIVIATWQVTTLAGQYFNSGSHDGVGTYAQFWDPVGVLTDGKYVFVTDRSNNAIRRIEISTGVTLTVLGQVSSFSGGTPTSHPGQADGTGTDAHFNTPQGIATDGNGTALWITDTGNSTIRKVQ